MKNIEQGPGRHVILQRDLTEELFAIGKESLDKDGHVPFPECTVSPAGGAFLVKHRTL